MKTYESVCDCGHPQSVHAGRTHLGVCATCHGASDLGQRPFCKRYRLMKKYQKEAVAQLVRRNWTVR